MLSPMGVSSSYITTAVFISGASEVVPPDDAPLRGTGFVAQMDAPDPDECYLHVVTAGHVVRPLACSFVRLSRRDGSVTSLAIPPTDWVFHPVEDVAAALISLDPSEIALTVIPTSSFVGTAETQFAPGPGDEVFFFSRSPWPSPIDGRAQRSDAARRHDRRTSSKRNPYASPGRHSAERPWPPH